MANGIRFEARLGLLYILLDSWFNFHTASTYNTVDPAEGQCASREMPLANGLSDETIRLRYQREIGWLQSATLEEKTKLVGDMETMLVE
jgi:hypothetical protein